MNNPKALWKLAGLLTVAIPTLVLGDSAYVSPTDQDIGIDCVCLVGRSGCQSNILASQGGKDVKTWVTPAHLLAGHTYDLNQTCYRKRDVDGQGDGMCCVADNESDSIKNLFRGTPQK